MSTVSELISQIKNKNDLIYIALMSLYAQKSSESTKFNSKKIILPELVYLLDEKSLINLITYFGGESISIPRPSEIKDQLFAILAYYYYDIEGIKDWRKIIDKLDLIYSDDLAIKLKQLRDGLIPSIEDIKLLSEIPNRKGLY